MKSKNSSTAFVRLDAGLRPREAEGKPKGRQREAMRTETLAIVNQIEQSLELLRRHL